MANFIFRALGWLFVKNFGKHFFLFKKLFVDNFDVSSLFFFVSLKIQKPCKKSRNKKEKHIFFLLDNNLNCSP